MPDKELEAAIGIEPMNEDCAHLAKSYFHERPANRPSWKRQCKWVAIDDKATPSQLARSQ
jgi:hypothetical protein